MLLLTNNFELRGKFGDKDQLENRIKIHSKMKMGGAAFFAVFALAGSEGIRGYYVSVGFVQGEGDPTPPPQGDLAHTMEPKYFSPALRAGRIMFLSFVNSEKKNNLKTKLWALFEATRNFFRHFMPFFL